MFARIAAVVGLVLIAHSAWAAPIQWPVSDGGNGHWYEYVAGNETWTSARVDAAGRTFDGLPGHLATLTSAAENDFIFQHFSPVQAWIGGYQDRNAPDYSEPAGGWRWVTGEPWVYTNWATQYGFPDNYGGNQDYAKFAAGPYWDDLQNDPSTGQSGVDGILVEYEAVPEPACLALLGVGGFTLARRRRNESCGTRRL